MKRVLQIIFVCVAACLATEVKADGDLSTCLVTFVTGDHETICVKVEADLLKNMPSEQFEVTWDAISYRLNESETAVEAFEKIGVAYRVGHAHIGISLDENLGTKSLEAIRSTDPKTRHAIMLLPKGSEKSRTNFLGMDKGEFTNSIRTEIRSKGMVVFPAALGRTALVTTCSCKGFFGGSSGCTSPTCTVSPIGSFCNSNPDCKKTDLTSVCSCQ